MLRIVLPLVFCSLFVGCASPTPRATLAAMPRLLRLQHEQSIATLHFPRGDYPFVREDRDGYYYRAPRGVMKHSFAGAERVDGGIFSSKKTDRLRGYIIWAGGTTRIGNIPQRDVQPID